MEQSFVDKYGNVYASQNFASSEQNYVVIKKDNEMACLQSGYIYSLPTEKDILLEVAPSFEFYVHSRIMADNKFLLEKQNYKVYEVEEANLQGTNLIWCKIENVLINQITFDATQKNGLKNMLVRVKNNA